MRTSVSLLALLAFVTHPSVPVSCQTERNPPPDQHPWWDVPPRIVEIGDAETARKLNASCVLCGAADDPTWGLFGQRVRMADSGPRVEQVHAAGMKALCWFEAFGTAGSIYVAQPKRSPDGTWVKRPTDHTVTRLFRNHWGWQGYDGTGEIRWIGVHNYFDDDDFARPYTRTHPRYGSPPMTYPDGTVAAGYNGSAADPRNSRVYDAGCAKNVFGQVTFDADFNAGVNEVVPATGKPRGRVEGLVKIGDKYASLLSPGKDSACPVWIDCARASVKQALDAGIDGLWCDNFSAWDSFSSQPLSKAFGEWSVATFRDYLRAHFAGSQLQALGVANVERFDVRAYLRDKCRAGGGKVEKVADQTLRDPFDSSGSALRDRTWRDPRWLDDPVWRAYLIHKRQIGTKALDAYYRAIKETAAQAGKRDFLISGNDIPCFSLGWVRGQLDMVSTELDWGWGLASGRRGFLPPPAGSFVPVYKLAQEHAKSRFVNVWMYVPEAQRGKQNVANVLFYQALANHTLPMAHPGNDRVAGDDATTAAFFDFVRQLAPTLGERTPVQEIGVYYSSSSQLMTFTPGGFVDHNNQEHMFAHWGWGTALSWLHYQYRAVPEWKLTREALAGLKVLVIADSVVFPPEDVGVLRQWVEPGGGLIVTADSGVRAGEQGNFEGLAVPSLSPLTGVLEPGTQSGQVVRAVGAGRVVYLPRATGLDFFKAEAERANKLPAFREALRAATGDGTHFALSATDGVPTTVGLTVYEDARANRLFVDVNNTDLDLATDQVTPSPPLRFTVRLPEFLRGANLKVSALSPGAATSTPATRPGKDGLEVDLPPMRLYTCVVIERERG
ncbi:MAG: hypothetical protein GW802_11635 [Armatimonadetes bacterium]|nr:hypothetical protein [Armatimonadota bacterium]